METDLQNKIKMANLKRKLKKSMKVENIKKAEDFKNISWSLAGTQKTNRQDAFLGAVGTGDMFLIDYIIEKNDNLPASKQFISEETAKQSLELALKEGQKKTLEYLLGHCAFFSKYGVNKDLLNLLARSKYKEDLKSLIAANLIDINERSQAILTEAAWSDNDDMCDLILDLGSDYITVFKRVKNSSGAVETLSNAVKRYEEKNKKVATEPEPKLLDKPKGNKRDDNSWEILEDSMIVHYTKMTATKTELQTVFNFKARDVTTICSMNNQTSVTLAIRNFKDLESDTELFEAWHKLKDAGTEPVPFTANDGFTVLKSKNKQPLRIEK